jgi:hypothetical protein
VTALFVGFVGEKVGIKRAFCPSSKVRVEWLSDTPWTATLYSPSSVPESHPGSIANTHKDSAIALRSFLNGISNRMFSTIGISYKDNNNRVKTLKFTNILSIAASHLHHQKITFEKVKTPIKITFGKVFSTV